MRTHPNARHMATIFDFPPPVCRLPHKFERDTLADPLIGEFSEWRRECAGWPMAAVVFASILVPFGVGLLAIVRGWVSVAPFWVHHL